MQLSYVYKLRPNSHQSQQMDEWLDMLRSLYNWLLADRIDGYQMCFVEGEYCDIRTKRIHYPFSCAINKNTKLATSPWKKNGKKRNAGLIQDAYLAELKKDRPWYKSIHSNSLQLLIARLNKAYDGFFQGKGFPKFKNRSRFRSFQYKPGDVEIKGNKVRLPKIGWMRFFNSRLIPPGFSIRTVTIKQKADGWYMAVLIEDKSVPVFPVPKPEKIKTLTGLDMGITKLVHCSDGSRVENPRFATNAKTKRQIKIRSRRASRKKGGSKNRRKAYQKVAKLHKKITDRREAYQWKVALKLVDKADAIAVEDLALSNMLKRCKPKKDQKTGRFLPNGQSQKRGLNRSISDASWSALVKKIEYMASLSGKLFIKVDPKGTSQKCSKCGHTDKANRDKEKFICTACGHMDHADLQASRNVKTRAVEKYGIKIVKRMVRRDSAKPPVQLRLELGTPILELTRLEETTRRQIVGKRRVPGNSIEQLSLFDRDIRASIMSSENPLTRS